MPVKFFHATPPALPATSTDLRPGAGMLVAACVLTFLLCGVLTLLSMFPYATAFYNTEAPPGMFETGYAIGLAGGPLAGVVWWLLMRAAVPRVPRSSAGLAGKSTLYGAILGAAVGAGLHASMQAFLDDPEGGLVVVGLVFGGGGGAMLGLILGIIVSGRIRGKLAEADLLPDEEYG